MEEDAQDFKDLFKNGKDFDQVIVKAFSDLFKSKIKLGHKYNIKAGYKLLICGSRKV